MPRNKLNEFQFNWCFKFKSQYLIEKAPTAASQAAVASYK